MPSVESRTPPSPPPCPPRQHLWQFVEGALPLSEHERVESHIDICDACQSTVVALDDESESIWGNLLPRGFHETAELETDSELESLSQEAKRMWRDTSAVATQTFTVGDEIGQYVIQGTLGAGNMGQVFLAYHQQMKRQVAIKLIVPELLASTAARQRFQREIQTAAKLQHPNLVAAYDAGESAGQHYLVMEYVPGTDLRTVVKNSGPMPVVKALTCAVAAAQGLQHAHERGIVHRDVKPGNLVLTSDGTVKVTDLGLARFAEATADSVEISQTGCVVGTAAFMSPEQCAGSREVDHRTDIYSLGCTLFYLLTGRHVFAAESTLGMLRAHAEQPVPALRTLQPTCSPQLEALLSCMLAKRPADRPVSMGCVAEQLSKLVENIERTERPVAKASFRTVAQRNLRKPMMVLGVLAFAVVGILLGREWFFPVLITHGLGGRRQQHAEMEMLEIAPGEFLMGAPKTDEFAVSNEQPQHDVKLTRAFLLGKFEVTVDQFRSVMGETRSVASPQSEKRAGRADEALPVSGVSWLEAIRFCNRLSKMQGLVPYYKIHESEGTVSIVRGSDGFRLPTEAEWEYACRAGTTTRWHFGDSPENLDAFAWYADNAMGEVHPVGQKNPNGFGLHDMLGNVPEWCWDRFDENYYAHSEAVNPPGATRGRERVFRGGGVEHDAVQLRSTSRNPLGMLYGVSNGVGFRVARDIVGAPPSLRD